MTDFDPRAYAYALVNTDAPAYAAEWLDSLDPDEIDNAEDTVTDWAHEQADGMAAVIYTYQALALYTAGITDDEDDDMIEPTLAGDEHASEVINTLVTGLSYVWHRRILEDAARELLAERLEAAESDED